MAIAIMVALASFGSIYALGVLSQHGCSLYTFGASGQSKTLSKGDYAQYTGRAHYPWLDSSVLAGTYLANRTADETVRLQVKDTNNSSVEWAEDDEITSNFLNSSIQDTYWARYGNPPIDFPYENGSSHLVSTFTLESYNATRLICGKVMTTTVYALNESSVFYDLHWSHFHTYYYVGQFSLLPVEIAGIEGNGTGITSYFDLFLTSTNISGMTVVQSAS